MVWLEVALEPLSAGVDVAVVDVASPDAGVVLGVDVALVEVEESDDGGGGLEVSDVVELTSSAQTPSVLLVVPSSLTVMQKALPDLL